MATLTGSTIAASYEQLLSLPDGGGDTTTLVAITDGDAGTTFALKVATTSISVGATNRIYLDGGSDTYIVESGADVLDFYVGAANMLKLTESSTDTVLVTGDLTVGVDDTGHNFTAYAATTGSFMKWNQISELLELRGPAGTPGSLLLSTAEQTVVDGNKLGRIDFQAPIDDAGTDAILIAASIYAEADATFSSSVNTTDLVFATGNSETATEKVRIDSAGNVGMACLDAPNPLTVAGTKDTDILTVAYTGGSGDDEGAQISFENYNSGATPKFQYLYARIKGGADSHSGDTGFLSFATNATSGVGNGNPVERMRIDSIGNVGIGDTDPSEAKLSITGVQAGDHALQVQQAQNYTAINIDSEATGYSSIYFDAPKQDTGRIIAMDSVDAITTGSAITIDAGGTTMATTHAGGLVEIMYDGAGTSANNLLYLKNDSATAASTIPLFIDQNANAQSIYIDSESTSQPPIQIEDPKTESASVLSIISCDALVAGSIAKFESDSSSTTARNLVEIINENAASVATECVSIRQDSQDYAMRIACTNTTQSNGIYILAGNDNADYPFSISNHDESKTLLSFNGDGAMRKPYQPAFSVRPASDQNAFAENTAVTIVFGTETIDQGGDFASNTFTAPVTGRYQLNVNGMLRDIEAAYDYYQLQLITSNRVYVTTVDPAGLGDLPYCGMALSVLADMDASDTAVVKIAAGGTGGGAGHDITAEGTFFSGFLAC